MKTTVLRFVCLDLTGRQERRVTLLEIATPIPRALALMVICRSPNKMGRLDCLEAAQSCEIFNQRKFDAA